MEFFQFLHEVGAKLKLRININELKSCFDAFFKSLRARLNNHYEAWGYMEKD